MVRNNDELNLLKEDPSKRIINGFSAKKELNIFQSLCEMTNEQRKNRLLEMYTLQSEKENANYKEVYDGILNIDKMLLKLQR